MVTFRFHWHWQTPFGATASQSRLQILSSTKTPSTSAHTSTLLPPPLTTTKTSCPNTPRLKEYCNASQGFPKFKSVLPRRLSTPPTSALCVCVCVVCGVWCVVCVCVCVCVVWCVCVCCVCGVCGVSSLLLFRVCFSQPLWLAGFARCWDTHLSLKTAAAFSPSIMLSVCSPNWLMPLFSTLFFFPPSLSSFAFCCFALTGLLQVLHGINAWQIQDQFPGLEFDAIVWNHPHLGVEDFRLHKFLMAHFFHSVTRCLKPSGFASVSLVQGQDERWEITAQARKMGLALFKNVSPPVFLFPNRKVFSCGGRREEEWVGSAGWTTVPKTDAQAWVQGCQPNFVAPNPNASRNMSRDWLRLCSCLPVCLCLCVRGSVCVRVDLSRPLDLSAYLLLR